MSSIKVTRGKLALLRKSPAKELLYDALNTVADVHGISIEDVDRICIGLERMYLSQIPKKQPRVKNVDLEDMIKTCKEEKK